MIKFSKYGVIPNLFRNLFFNEMLKQVQHDEEPQNHD
jgi:hypothetical protein